MRSRVLTIVLLSLFLCSLVFSFNIPIAKSGPSTITVPDDFPTIQAAVDNAGDGDTVFVRSGTYYEHVVVNKAVALVGENLDNTIIDGSYVGVVVNATRDGIGISGFTIRKSGTAWNIGGPPYGAGIYMRNVTNCSVAGNKFTDDAAAIQLEYGADGNVIANNTMMNVGLGWGTFDASMNSFIGNNISSSGRGLGLNVNSDNNLISCNRITAPEWVMALHACHYNNVTENYIANGQIGIYLPDSSYNLVFHNQIINNIQQASLQGFPSRTNYWDDGYPSGGNYWNNYAGKDTLNGPLQNETGGDGIGDTPYTIDTNNTDRFPLMYPWSLEHDVAVTNLVSGKTVVGKGYLVSLNVTVENQGPYTAEFNVATYANSTIIDSSKVSSLAGGTATKFALARNTTDLSYGNYILWAYAEPVLNEADISDNNCTCLTSVHVGVPGDISGPILGQPDGKCDMRDISYLISHFNCRPGDPKWLPNCDINSDDVINMRDISIAIVNFQKHE